MVNVRHQLNFTSFAIAALFTTCALSANAQDNQIALISNSHTPNTNTNTNTNNIVSISTKTLAIDWNGLSVNSTALTVDRQPQKVTHLVIDSKTKASWALMPSGIIVEAELNEDILLVQFNLPSNAHVYRN